MFDFIPVHVPTPEQQTIIDQLVNWVKTDQTPVLFRGITGSGKTLVAANLIANTNLPTLIIAPTISLAKQLFDRLSDHFPNKQVHLFPSKYKSYASEKMVNGQFIYETKEREDQSIIDQRLTTLNLLIAGKAKIIVSSLAATMDLTSPDKYQASFLLIQTSQQTTPERLMQQLREIGYHQISAEQQFVPGMYQLVSPNKLSIFLIGHDGEEFQQITINFNYQQITQIESDTNQLISKINISPAKENIKEDKTWDTETVINNIKKELDTQVQFLLNQNQAQTANQLQQTVEADFKQLREKGECANMFRYKFYFLNQPLAYRPFTLFSYFKAPWLLIIDESHKTIPFINDQAEAEQKRLSDLITNGYNLPSVLNCLGINNFNTLQQTADRILYLSATPGEFEIKTAKHKLELAVRPTGILDPTVKLILAPDTTTIKTKLLHALKQHFQTSSDSVLIFTISRDKADSWAKELNQNNFKTQRMHSSSHTKVERLQIIKEFENYEFNVFVLVGLLREGFDNAKVGLVIILDGEAEYKDHRTSKALLQMIGRATRNKNGKAIIFARKLTSEIEIALKQTTKQRLVQQKHLQQK